VAGSRPGRRRGHATRGRPRRASAELAQLLPQDGLRAGVRQGKERIASDPECIPSQWSQSTASSTSLAASRDVARARERPPVPKCTRLVPAKRRYLAITGNQKNRICRSFLPSPLTDSNHRPPPYHFGVSATGGNRRQRFWLDSAVSGVFRFATGCHWLRPLGSINAPYSPRRSVWTAVRIVAEPEALAEAIGRRYGPSVIFAAATGLPPAEWIALEKRDVDRDSRVVYVRRSFTKESSSGRRPKRACEVSLQARALDALARVRGQRRLTASVSSERGGYPDIHPLPPLPWRPAQVAAGIEPLRRIYDLRHTFATFALGKYPPPRCLFLQ
jgi:hypothetical protein